MRDIACACFKRLCAEAKIQEREKNVFRDIQTERKERERKRNTKIGTVRGAEKRNKEIATIPHLGLCRKVIENNAIGALSFEWTCEL